MTQLTVIFQTYLSDGRYHSFITTCHRPWSIQHRIQSQACSCKLYHSLIGFFLANSVVLETLVIRLNAYHKFSAPDFDVIVKVDSCISDAFLKSGRLLHNSIKGFIVTEVASANCWPPHRCQDSGRSKYATAILSVVSNCKSGKRIACWQTFLSWLFNFYFAMVNTLLQWFFLACNCFPRINCSGNSSDPLCCRLPAMWWLSRRSLRRTSPNLRTCLARKSKFCG